uniref:Uncharacterized protein n=1 Tax=Ixodes ricinus TaxID=34613 RepID=A0A6B0TZE3_IXORI
MLVLVAWGFAQTQSETCHSDTTWAMRACLNCSRSLLVPPLSSRPRAWTHGVAFRAAERGPFRRPPVF